MQDFLHIYNKVCLLYTSLLLQQCVAGGRLPTLPRLEDHFYFGRSCGRNGEAFGIGKDK